MIIKTCGRCGKQFPIYDKKYNARKFCNECRNKRRVYKSCRFCGQSFVTQDYRRKYCSKSCSDNARNDKIREYVLRYYKKYPWKKIRRGLGTSILKQHRNEDFTKELQQIQSELKRVGLK